MLRIRNTKTACRYLLTFALACWLGACHKWVEAEPAGLALQEQAELPVEDRAELRIRVEPDGGTYEGVLQQLSRDSAVLVTDDGPVAVREADIAHLESRAPDPLATLAVVLASVVGIMAAVVVIHDLVICDSAFSC